MAITRTRWPLNATSIGLRKKIALAYEPYAMEWAGLFLSDAMAGSLAQFRIG